jgi:outer membrane cobalamin receptor
MEDELMDEFAFLEESGVVESAARHKQEIGMSPSAITVITREDIEASGANTVADLLRMVPGMDVAVASPFVTAITSRLYWTYENNHYLVLVDGREANIELFGQSAWEMQPIELEDIQRIEVIRGPGSSLYGANAFAGVVSITTRAVPEKTSGWSSHCGSASLHPDRQLGILTQRRQERRRLVQRPPHLGQGSLEAQVGSRVPLLGEETAPARPGVFGLNRAYSGSDRRCGGDLPDGNRQAGI